MATPAIRPASINHDGISAENEKRDNLHLEQVDVDKKQDRDVYNLKSEQDDLGTLQTLWRFRHCCFICIMMCVAAAADGYQTNLNGAVIANNGFQRLMGAQDSNGKYVINAQHNALWGAMQSFGQMMAMVWLNPISDRIGRKWTLYVLWVILLGSLLLESFVKDWKMWTGAKIMAGLGVGAVQSTLPVFIAEWAPVNIRGIMILSYGVLNNFGNFMAPVVLSICEKKNPLDYKTPILTQWVFLGLMLPIFLYLPETPSYFAARGLHEKGLKTLQRVNGRVKGYNCEEEYAIIVNTIEEERAVKEMMGGNQEGFKAVMRSYAACFKGVNKMRTLGASIPAVCQQTLALSLLNIYGALFFKQAGYTNAFEVKAILTSLKIVGVFLAIFLGDRYGRRVMVLFGACWAWVCLVIVAAGGAHTDKPAISKLVVAAACIWSVGSGIMGSTGWTFCGEVASQRLRARTSGLAAAIGVIFGLTFNTSVPIMIDVRGANMGFTAVWIFVGIGGVATLFAFYICPEPARRSPAELDELFEKHIPAWRMKAYVTDVEKSYNANKQNRNTAAGYNDLA